ncbi:MAG: type IV pilin protein [Betaproteobacteria bacterium]
MRQASQAGFTLLELMITAAVVAVLAAVAVPQFGDYTKRGKIPEAVATLSDLRMRLERYYADNRTYVGFPVTAPGARYFTYTCPTLTASTYTCQAAGPGGAPANDASMAGFTYTINQSNTKTSAITVSGWGNSASCWISKKGEVC